MQSYTRARLREIFNQRNGLDKGGHPTDRKSLFEAFLAGAEAVGGLAEWTPLADRLPYDGQEVVVKREDGTIESIREWNSSHCLNWSGSWTSANSSLAREAILTQQR